VRPRVFQESRVDMARQCVGHGARPAPLGVRWDLAGDARSRLPRVATVLPGGAADRAGLQAGDRLVGVTGGGRRLSLRKWAAAADRPPLERITERMGCRALHPKHRKHPDETRPVSTGGRDETRPVSTGGRDETCPVSTGGRGGGGLARGRRDGRRHDVLAAAHAREGRVDGVGLKGRRADLRE